MTVAIDRDALDRFTRKSDLRGAWLILCQWSLTVAIFAVVAVWTNPFTLLVGAILLGGRQLGFFVLTHEAGHRTLFNTQRLNDFVGTWLTAPLDYTNGKAYMREHLEHHRAVGQPSDPDLANYADYPITRERLRRKLKRDLTGQTGWRNLRSTYGRLFKLGSQDAETRSALLRGLTLNLAMVVIMALAGHPWLYLLWLFSYVFVYPAIVRIRQIAEHAAVPQLNAQDPFLNTRTTIANPLVRLIFCPHQVNYHIEHHLFASVPIYRLKALHKHLVEKGGYVDVKTPHGYLSVLKAATA